MLSDDAQKDLKIAHRTKCRVWLKTRLAYWINRCMEAEAVNGTGGGSASVESLKQYPVVVDPVKSGERFIDQG